MPAGPHGPGIAGSGVAGLSATVYAARADPAPMSTELPASAVGD